MAVSEPLASELGALGSLVFGSGLVRRIDCSHRAALRIVYETLQAARSRYAQQLTTDALASAAARRALQESVAAR